MIDEHQALGRHATYDRNGLLIENRLHPSTRIKRDELWIQPGRKRCAEDLYVLRVDIEFLRDGDEASSDATRITRAVSGQRAPSHTGNIYWLISCRWPEVASMKDESIRYLTKHEPGTLWMKARTIGVAA